MPIYNKILKDFKQETFPYLVIYYELSKEELSEEDLLKKTELNNLLLNHFLNLLIKSKKIEKTSNGKYKLKVRSQDQFLPGK